MTKNTKVFETAGQCAECGRMTNFYGENKFEVEERFMETFTNNFGEVKRFEKGESFEVTVGKNTVVVTFKFHEKCDRCDPKF